MCPCRQRKLRIPASGNHMRSSLFSESTYKKHCSILTNAGYIRIHQRTKLNKNNHFCYGSNTYELVSSPPSYIRYCEGKVDEYGQSFVSGEGIEGAGYGTIPYYVMCMKNLSADAKAVYAYLCSLCGAGELAYLSYAGISNILNISRNSTDKYMKALISSGLITITQMRKPDGTYGLGRCVIKKKIATASERVSSMETYQTQPNPKTIPRRKCLRTISLAGYKWFLYYRTPKFNPRRKFRCFLC